MLSKPARVPRFCGAMPFPVMMSGIYSRVWSVVFIKRGSQPWSAVIITTSSSPRVGRNPPSQLSNSDTAFA